MSHEKKPIDYSFRGLDTVVVPDIFFKTLKSGEDIDSTLSDMGGVVPSQVILVSGNPGAGKTTLAAKVAAAMAKKHSKDNQKRKSAMISLEMSDFQLAAQAKKLDAEYIEITMGFAMDETFARLKEMQPTCIILDSIQKAAKLLGYSYNKALQDVMAAFVAFSKETFIPVFIICHADKSGNYKGPSDLEHDCDTHLRVFYDEDLEVRTFWWVKNRFGGDPREKMFGIESDKVWIGDPYGVRREKKHEPIRVPGEDAYTSLELSKMWKSVSDTGDWNTSYLRSLITHTVDFLRGWEKDPLLVGGTEKVHLSFESNHVADCNGRTGKLRFGTKCWNPEGFAIGKIGYGKEQPFIQRWCKTSHELLLWVVLHEWTHLYPGMQHHKLDFFRRVEKLAKDTNLFQAFKADESE